MPAYGDLDGGYQPVQLQVQFDKGVNLVKRFTRGLQLNANYTWGPGDDEQFLVGRSHRGRIRARPICIRSGSGPALTCAKSSSSLTFTNYLSSRKGRHFGAAEPVRERIPGRMVCGGYHSRPDGRLQMPPSARIALMSAVPTRGPMQPA